jgi:hypothetical protein
MYEYDHGAAQLLAVKLVRTYQAGRYVPDPGSQIRDRIET